MKELSSTTEVKDRQNTSGLSVIVDGLEIPFSRKKVVFPQKFITPAITLIKEWEGKFAEEETWIRNNHGIPSPIVRIDATEVDGELKLFEIEDRPAGIGLTSIINPQFAMNLDDITTTWPAVEAVVSSDPNRRFKDDKLWIPETDKDMVQETALVRAHPEEEEFHALEPVSISTVKMEGDKGYGERMGLWSPVTDPGELPMERPFVLKPRSGRGSSNVFVYLPPEVKEEFRTGEGAKVGGTYRANDIRRNLRRALERDERGMYLQDFYPPMPSDISEEHPWMIYRFFFGCDLKTHEWKPLGGTWYARPNLIIHGASDALTGPLVIEQTNTPAKKAS